MRKMLFVLAMVLVMTGIAQAQPYLTCNSVPAGSWDSIGVRMDTAAEVFVTPRTNTDGTQTLWFDLSGLAVGNHNVQLRGKKGVWYGAVTPFAFTKPNVPSVSAVSISE